MEKLKTICGALLKLGWGGAFSRASAFWLTKSHAQRPSATGDAQRLRGRWGERESAREREKEREREWGDSATTQTERKGDKTDIRAKTTTEGQRARHANKHCSNDDGQDTHR